MNTDNLILILALIVAVSLILVLAFVKPEKKPQAFWHFLLMGVYCTLFSYLYINQSGNGSALAWWFYWLMSAIIHSVVLSVLLMKKLNMRR